MIEASDVYFYWTESPLHAGVGASTGVIDQPIQRDKATGHPIVHFSTVKGALRDHFYEHSNKNKAITNAIFGPDDNASEHAAAISMSDARIILFPVRSFRGVTAWVTSPLALAYLWRDLERCDLKTSFPALPDKGPDEGCAWVTSKSPVALYSNAAATSQIVLEE